MIRQGSFEAVSSCHFIEVYISIQEVYLIQILKYLRRAKIAQSGFRVRSGYLFNEHLKHLFSATSGPVMLSMLTKLTHKLTIYIDSQDSESRKSTEQELRKRYSNLL